MEGRTVRIEIDDRERTTLGAQGFKPFGIAGRAQATFEWAWDTSGLQPGDYDAELSIHPRGTHLDRNAQPAARYGACGVLGFCN